MATYSAPVFLILKNLRWVKKNVIFLHKHTILLNQVADVENLRIEPAVELHIVEALYAKFEVRNII